MNGGKSLLGLRGTAGGRKLPAHRRVIGMGLIVAVLVGILAVPLTGVSATSPISEPFEAALREARSADKAADASAARYTALAEYYLDKGADASSARLTALARHYGAISADSERYAALGEYYLEKGAEIDSARLAALAEFYATKSSPKPNALADHVVAKALMAANIADDSLAENPELSAFNRYAAVNDAGDGGFAENPELSAFRWYAAAIEDSSVGGSLAENPELSAFNRYASVNDAGDGGLAENPELSAFLWFQAEQEAKIPPLLCRADC
jgi:hypothetical protein